MTLKSMKISEDNYRWLVSVAGDLQSKSGAPVSLDEAIFSLRKGRSISELAGSWDMSDEEAEKIKRDLKKGWKSWQIESV